MSIPLFTSEDASDPAYCNIRDAKQEPLRSSRSHCEYLWLFFQQHADREFRREIRSNFDARYWEMYLTTALILDGYEVTCPKPGPDVGIKYRGQRIWFEAVSPTGGSATSPDYVAPPPQNGTISNIPNDKIVLRYLNSISEKYERQYAKWLENKIVASSDAFVIAINPRAIPFDFVDSSPPRILQAAYTLGEPYAVIDRATLTAIGSGYHFRDIINKEPKSAAKHDPNSVSAAVNTGVFQDGAHNGLSALLCSRVDVANRRGEFGSDYQLVPNPHANVSLPTNFRLRGTYFAVARTDGGYRVTPEQVDKPR